MFDPDHRPDISVIIATFNGATTLPTQLLALERQDFEGRFEILICDNGSRDRTLEIALEWVDRLPLLRVLDASDMPGGGFAKSVGVINATAPLLAFCDQDDYVLPTWLSAVRRGLDEHDIVTGPLGKVDHDFDRMDPREVVDETTFSPGFDCLEGVPVASGCNCGFVRDALSQGFADIDAVTSLRAIRHGYEIGWCPDAKILYRSRPPGGPALQRAISSGAWRAALDREFGGVLYTQEHQLARSVVWLCLHAPGALVRGELDTLRWPLGLAVGGMLERVLPGYWWGRIGARRLAGKADSQAFVPDSAAER